jgi:uncharacterized membrane protein
MRSREMSILIAALGCILLTAGMLSAQSAPSSNMTVTRPSAFAISPPSSQIGQQASSVAPTVVPLRTRLQPPAPAGAVTLNRVDEALQTTAGDRLEEDDDDGGGAHFPGVGQNGYAPSDANLAVGPNHVLQIVNTEYAVYDKSGNIFAGYPKTLGSLFTNLGGSCTGEWGDPIAQYDRAADRWLITQLGSFSAPYLECIAVSVTNDPTGSYYLYSYSFDNFENTGLNFLNDYDKISVWPSSTNSAYLATYNLYTNGASEYGAALCAYDRAAMLSGAASPTEICFIIANDLSYLSSDLDGPTLPPTGEPAHYLTWETATTLRYYDLAPNFANPASSTLSAPNDIPIATLTLACGGSGGSCIPQPNTTQLLDSLGDRPMYRLAYRNFGDHEAMVVNQSVDTGSSVGVRWYELRSPLSGTFTLYQQGTFAPDSNYRWMGSAAMDQAGDIAIGYSESSSSMFPSIYYTGRIPTDALGTMRAETSLLQGTGSQTGLSRWGDYSALRIDPSDDCTFWYTNQYLPSTGSFNWATFVGSFKLSNCSAAPDFSISASPASQPVTQGNSGSYTITMSSLGGYAGSVTLSATGLPTGANATFGTNPITGGSGNSAMNVTTSSSTPAGSYPLTITGVSGNLTHTTTATLVVNAAVIPDFSISSSPASWTLTAGTSTSYTATVTPSGGFNSSVGLTAAGLPSGATATFNPSSISGGSGSSTMSVNTTTGTSPGTYTVTINGTGGSATHSTTVTLVVNAAPAPDFSISATPTSQNVTQGTSATYKVMVGPLNGFTGSVSLSATSAPSGAGATFSPSSITISSGSGASTMTTSTTTPPGSYTVTITGSSGNLTHSTTVTLVVNSSSQGFSLAASPTSRTVTQGSSASYTATVTPSGGFNASVTLSVSGLPSGARATFSSNPINGGSGHSTVRVSTNTSTAPGTYALTITGTSGSVTQTTTVALVVNAFSISVSPSSHTVARGNTTTYAVTVTALNGFNGTVSLRARSLPSNTSASFNPSSITASGTSTMTVTTTTSTPTGTFNVGVRGSSGNLTLTSTVELVVQ